MAAEEGQLQPLPILPPSDFDAPVLDENEQNDFDRLFDLSPPNMAADPATANDLDQVNASDPVTSKSQNDNVAPTPPAAEPSSDRANPDGDEEPTDHDESPRAPQRKRKKTDKNRVQLVTFTNEKGKEEKVNIFTAEGQARVEAIKRAQKNTSTPKASKWKDIKATEDVAEGKDFRPTLAVVDDDSKSRIQKISLGTALVDVRVLSYDWSRGQSSKGNEQKQREVIHQHIDTLKKNYAQSIRRLEPGDRLQITMTKSDFEACIQYTADHSGRDADNLREEIAGFRETEKASLNFDEFPTLIIPERITVREMRGWQNVESYTEDVRPVATVQAGQHRSLALKYYADSVVKVDANGLRPTLLDSDAEKFEVAKRNYCWAMNIIDHDKAMDIKNERTLQDIRSNRPNPLEEDSDGDLIHYTIRRFMQLPEEERAYWAAHFNGFLLSYMHATPGNVNRLKRIVTNTDMRRAADALTTAKYGRKLFSTNVFEILCGLHLSTIPVSIIKLANNQVRRFFDRVNKHDSRTKEICEVSNQAVENVSLSEIEAVSKCFYPNGSLNKTKLLALFCPKESDGKLLADLGGQFELTAEDFRDHVRVPANELPPNALFRDGRTHRRPGFLSFIKDPHVFDDLLRHWVDVEDLPRRVDSLFDQKLQKDSSLVFFPSATWWAKQVIPSFHKCSAILNFQFWCVAPDEYNTCWVLSHGGSGSRTQLQNREEWDWVRNLAKKYGDYYETTGEVAEIEAKFREEQSETDEDDPQQEQRREAEYEARVSRRRKYCSSIVRDYADDLHALILTKLGSHSVATVEEACRLQTPWISKPNDIDTRRQFFKHCLKNRFLGEPMRLFIETFGAGFMGGMPRGLAWKGRREGSGIDFFDIPHTVELGTFTLTSTLIRNSSFANAVTNKDLPSVTADVDAYVNVLLTSRAIETWTDRLRAAERYRERKSNNEDEPSDNPSDYFCQSEGHIHSQQEFDNEVASLTASLRRLANVWGVAVPTTVTDWFNLSAEDQSKRLPHLNQLKGVNWNSDNAKSQAHIYERQGADEEEIFEHEKAVIAKCGRVVVDAVQVGQFLKTVEERNARKLEKKEAKKNTDKQPKNKSLSDEMVQPDDLADDDDEAGDNAAGPSRTPRGNRPARSKSAGKEKDNQSGSNPGELTYNQIETLAKAMSIDTRNEADYEEWQELEGRHKGGLTSGKNSARMKEANSLIIQHGWSKQVKPLVSKTLPDLLKFDPKNYNKRFGSRRDARAAGKEAAEDQLQGPGEERQDEPEETEEVRQPPKKKQKTGAKSATAASKGGGQPGPKRQPKSKGRAKK